MANSTEIASAKQSIQVIPQFSEDDIRNRIYTIRGVQVMLDRDLAEMYNDETRRINEAVKRNAQRFPEDFVFQLTKEEWNALRSQFATSVYSTNLRSQFATSKRGGVRYLPYAFTEEGIAQLAGTLHNTIAIEMSVRIIRAFVAMRRFIAQNAGVFQRIDQIEKHLILTDTKVEETNSRIDHVLNQMEDGTLRHKLGVFFENQMFDAYVLFEELIKRGQHRIVLIDDYVDGEVLERLQVRKKSVPVDIYVHKQHKTKCMETVFSTYHQQYPLEHVELHVFNQSHDRWLIVDDDVFHFGASIKDLGKKWFEVSKITEYTAQELIERISICDPMRKEKK